MPENIDDKFYEAMRSIGGLRPAEIDPEAGRALNADVVFRDENVILEVKTLMADPTERADHIEKVSAIYNRWAGRPGVPIIFGRGVINSADVPWEMGFELTRTLADPIRTAVTKANRQIRRVKASLDMPEAHGVLLLCNAGATTLTPHMILHALHHALGYRHSSINSAIFMTHGVPANVPGVPEPVEVFVPASRPSHEPLPTAFSEKIRDAWLQFQARTQPVRFYSVPDGNILSNAANAR
jgi:hypothetical protein